MNQVEWEEQWSEDNYIQKIRDSLKDSDEFNEVEIEILTFSIANGFTPISNVIGAASSALWVLPNNAQRQSVLEACIDLAEDDWVEIVEGNIVYLEPKIEIEGIEYSRLKFIPPMIEPPKVVTKNNELGYHVTKSGHVMAGLQVNRHDGDLCLDVINKINSFKWSVSTEVTKERPVKPLKMEQDVFDTFTGETIDLINEIGSEGLYFAHRVDTRGRIYCHGYHLSYQSEDWRRAMIQLPNPKQVVGEL